MTDNYKIVKKRSGLDAYKSYNKRVLVCFNCSASQVKLGKKCTNCGAKPFINKEEEREMKVRKRNLRNYDYDL